MPDARNHQLDGLRGYAAAAVVVYHAILGTDPALTARVLPSPVHHLDSGSDLLIKAAIAIANGEAAVTIFFVLSGAVLFASLQRQPAPLPFVVRRLFRIYPALVAAIALGAVILLAQGRPPSLAQIAADIALFDFRIIGAAWTLQVEVLAIPFILASFWAGRRFGAIGIVAVFVVAFLIMKMPALKPIVVMIKPQLLPFTLGFLVASPLGAALGRRLSAPWFAVALVAVLLARHVVPSPNVALYTLQLSAGLLVCALYHGRAGWFGEALARPTSRLLGRISYSLYLLNVPLLLAFEPWLRGSAPLLVGLPLGLLIIALTVPMAIAAERWIERPGIRLGARIAAAWPFSRGSDERSADLGAEAPLATRTGP